MQSDSCFVLTWQTCCEQGKVGCVFSSGKGDIVRELIMLVAHIAFVNRIASARRVATHFIQMSMQETVHFFRVRWFVLNQSLSLY